MKKKLILALILIGSFTSYSLSGKTPGDIPVLDFESFEPLLQKENDTVYVVNFWATWCVPCRKEMPELEKLNTNSDKYGTKVLLVSLDFPNKIETSLIPYITKNNIQSEIVLLDAADPNSWIDKVHTDWSGSIPATLIYKGNKRVFIEKQITYDELINIIKTKF